jgi:hypothetical protein
VGVWRATEPGVYRLRLYGDSANADAIRRTLLELLERDDARREGS